MPTPYVGTNSYTAAIDMPIDSDPPDAAAISTPLEQLADRTAYLKTLVEAEIGFELTDAVLHGNTTFPDGTIGATVTSMSLVASGGISLASTAGLLFVGGNSFEIGSTTTVLVGAGTDMTINVGDDLTMTIVGDWIVTGVDTFDFNGGKFIIDATHFELADDVTLGGGTGDTITVAGTLACAHNATFAGSKTVTLSGATTAADLRATVSNASGITYSGAGRAHYRQVSLVEADFGGTYYILSAAVADIVYVTALSSGTQTMKIGDSLAVAGDVVEVSTLGMTGGFNVEIYDDAGSPNLLLTMTATGNSYSRWVKKTTTGWRLLCVSDG